MENQNEKVIKWRTSNYSNDIKPYEIAMETEKTVFYLQKNIDGRTAEVASRKEQTYSEWHNSFEDARQYLIARAQKELERCVRVISNQTKEIERLKLLTPPHPTKNEHTK